ncbi:MAG: DUF3078 domain-containing protein [Rikenellaceae bacterium]
MKGYVKELFLLVMLLFMPIAMSAQMTIDRPKTTKQENVKFQNVIKFSSLDSVDYFSLAQYKAERAALRKERNTLEITGSLQGTLTAYNDPWISTSGGDNTTALLGSFSLNHIYKRNLMTLTTKVSAKLGINRIKIDTGTDDDGNTISEGVWFKNQDEISITITPTFSISSKWSYGPEISFRTQFANGYTSRSSQEDIHLKSGFMAPGYLDISGVMQYKSSSTKLPITVSVSPFTLSAVYVSNDYVKENFLYGFSDHTEDNWSYTEPYGVSYLNNSKYEGGSSIKIEFDRTFEKLAKIRYQTSVYSFYGWMTQASAKNVVNNYDEYIEELATWSETYSGDKPMLGIQPTVRWENTVTIPATDILSTKITFQLYYNRAQDIKVQTQTYLSIGLSYTYKNK